MSASQQKFHSDNQSFWELASIPCASTGISLIKSAELSQIYGIKTAALSILIANLILWLIAVAMISINKDTKNTTIDNINFYLGRFGGLLASLILLFTFLEWYALQINLSMSATNSITHFENELTLDLILRLGATLGLLSALLSTGGIKILKKLSVFFLPLLIAYFIYQMVTFKGVLPESEWKVSFFIIVSIIPVNLPGVINFPTLFRHSKSKAHSFLALTMITIIISFFEIGSLWVKSSTPGGAFDIGLTIFVIFSAVIISNMLNVYFASACWEMIVPKFESGKGFAIIGLLGTLIYTFIQISGPVLFLQDLTNSYVACVGVSLILGYLARMIVNHRPRTFEKLINLASWLFGCVVATVAELDPALKGVPALLNGISASALFFLGVFFIEEIIWAIRKKHTVMRILKHK